MSEKKDYELKIGSVYTVTVKEKEVTGAFCGYAMIGSETALVIEDENGTVYVSADSVVMMRLIRKAPENEPESPKDVYYG
ncbi:MAG: hypothetical protein WC082_14215 [Victivallales bacterium]